VLTRPYKKKEALALYTQDSASATEGIPPLGGVSGGKPPPQAGGKARPPYQYVKINGPYYCLQQNPAVLAWFLYFGNESLRLRSLRLSKRQSINAVKALVQHQLKLRDRGSVVELPVYGHLCLPVHRGYRVFDFRRRAVIRTFSPEVDTAVVAREIEAVRSASHLDFAPAVRHWSAEERWYEEDFVIGYQARLIPKEPGAVLRIYRQDVEPCLERMILSQAPCRVGMSEYVRRVLNGIMDALENGRSLGQGVNARKADTVRQFVELVAEQLRLRVSRIHNRADRNHPRDTDHPNDPGAALVFSHGDFSLRNMLMTKDGITVIDWESAGRRSVLFDLYNYFFTESYYGRIATNLVSEINEAISSLQSRIRSQAPDIAETLSSLTPVYRRLYYLERILVMLEREMSDDLLDVILRSIQVFKRYEEALAGICG
jgi:hypothetical protein